MTAPVAALVLASRGGARLEEALASVAWASERLVLDPARRLAGSTSPALVVRGREPADAASAPWLLLLEEQERVPAALAATITQVACAPGALAAYRIGQEAHAFGAALALPGAPVRLVRRAGARLAVRAGLQAELRPAHGRAGRLRGRLVADGAPSLAQAVEELEADASALAALLHERGVRPGVRHLLLAPLGPSARVLLARGRGGGLGGRWALAVLAGYRALVGYAKLWEARRAEGSRPR
jgi:hypothetical protein